MLLAEKEEAQRSMQYDNDKQYRHQHGDEDMGSSDSFSQNGLTF
jgi:hypothetical protein